MGSTYLAQAGFFQPILDGMRASGTNVERLLAKAGLHRFDLENADNYVPQHAMLKLFDLIEEREGVEDFISCFGNRLQVAQLANWGNTLSHRSNLLSACRFAARYGHVVLTNERITLEVIGRKAKVSLMFPDSPVKDMPQFECVNFAYMYSTFSLAAGAGTAPDEIHLHSHKAPDLDTLLPSGSNTRIRHGQSATALVFPVEILGSAMLGLASRRESKEAFPEEPPGVADSIGPILDSWAGNRVPNLVAIADALGMSSRTLQRRITEEGKKFSEVVDDWRFTKSIELISNPRITIGEIGERLRYANTPNFDRAFRRWTGLSPTTYRENH